MFIFIFDCFACREYARDIVNKWLENAVGFDTAASDLLCCVFLFSAWQPKHILNPPGKLDLMFWLLWQG